MRILAGRHLPKPVGGAPPPVVKVLGLNAFHDTRLNFHRAYLDCDWGMRSIAFVGAAVPLMADIAVRNMMEKLQAEYPDRRDELIDMLGIDLDWVRACMHGLRDVHCIYSRNHLTLFRSFVRSCLQRMHQLSDGQRRRVQIFLGLIRPFQILCLDEITTSLDVVVRQDLLRWLVKESDDRGATIVYATHIFDGLDDWATHLLYLSDQGTCGWQGRMDELELYRELRNNQHPAKMLAIAEHWLRGELAERRQKRQREKAMGAAALLEEMDVTDRNQGGYASGRLRTKEEDTQDKKKKDAMLARSASASPASAANSQSVPARQGRLSDVMGNRGVLDKVARVAGD